MFLAPFTDGMAKYLARDLSVMQITWLRSTVMTLFLGALLLRRWRLLLGLDLWSRRNILRGFLWWIATFSFFLSLKYNDVPSAFGAYFTGPLYMAVAAPLFLGEKPNLRAVAAAIIAFLGMLLVFAPVAGEFRWSLTLSMLSGIIYATYIMVTRHGAKVHASSAILVSMSSALWASVVGLPAAVAGWTNPTSHLWMVVVAMGLLTACVHTMLAMACERLEAGQLAPFMYVEIIGALAVSLLLFGELPAGRAWLGIGLIVGAGVWFAFPSRARSP